MKKIRRLVLLIFMVTCIAFALFTGGRFLKRDTEGPKITMDKEKITASIEDTDQTLMKGVKAVDDKDKDVSDSLIIESMKMGGDGKATLVYAAFDKSNNVAKASRTVEFKDYTPIHFSITQPLRFPLGSDSQILKSITATDCMDGDITNRIKLTKKNDESDYKGEGIYDYEVSVTNNMGDKAILPISVEFYADSYEERLFHPNIYLKQYILYLEKGSSFQPKDYLDSVEIGDKLYVFDENISAEESMTEMPQGETASLTQDGKQIYGVISYDAVKYQSNVKTKEPGVYTVEFSCTTKDKYTGAVQMIVIVE